MSEDLPVLWSPAQQAWLQAMGYTVYHDGQLAAELDAALQLSVADAEAAATPAAEQARASTAPAREPLAAAAPVSRQERPAPARRETPVSAPDTAPAAARPLPGGNARQPVVRLPGLSLERVAQAVMSVFPLAVDVAQPAGYMQHSGLPVGQTTPAQAAFIELACRLEGLAPEQVEPIERFAFYERIAGASLIVQSGEASAFGNAILCKGVILP